MANNNTDNMMKQPLLSDTDFIRLLIFDLTLNLIHFNPLFSGVQVDFE